MHYEQQTIRERAYSIWEREGCPEGREQEHWTLAEREIVLEQNGVKTAVDPDADAAPETTTRRRRPAAKTGAGKAAASTGRTPRTRKSPRTVSAQT